MRSDTPRHPGPQAAQAAHDELDRHAGARGTVQGLNDGRLGERVELRDDARGLARAGVLGFAIDLRDDRLVQAERRVQELAQLRNARESGELQEDLVNILADRLVGGQQSVIGVQAGGLRVIVARAQMAVAPQPLFLPAHDHHQLGVRLEAEDPVHDVRAGFLQLVRELDIGLFVEARAQLDDHRHVLVRLRRFHQGADDRRIAPRAIQGLLDRENLRICGRLLDEIRDGRETLKGMMQQHVSAAQRRE
jgi:hypothetical protein